MAVHFEKLKIKKINRETPDCVSIEFEIPESLASKFTFREGQNITIKKEFNGEEIRRSYSICSAPFEEKLSIAVKSVDNGIFSNYANTQLKPGDELDLLPPTGNFSPKFSATTKHNLAIAAGSGITPIISIIKQTLELASQSTFTLIYGNRNRQSVIFIDELEGLKSRFLERFNLINVFSRESTDSPIHEGRITPEKLSVLRNMIDYHSMDNIFLCGPEELIFSSSDYFKSIGIDERKIHFELFTIPGQDSGSSVEKSKEEVATKGKTAEVTVSIDGRSLSFNLEYDGMSVLDAGLAQGLDLPYSCKGGVCSTCKAKVLEGEVEMDNNYALEDDEVAQGFVLTCQSHPRTPKVVVDYDER